MASKLSIAVVCVGLAFRAAGGQFFVTPQGTAQGNGTSLRPWDLATALADNTKTQNVNNVVKLGDIGAAQSASTNTTTSTVTNTVGGEHSYSSAP